MSLDGCLAFGQVAAYCVLQHDAVNVVVIQLSPLLRTTLAQAEMKARSTEVLLIEADQTQTKADTSSWLEPRTSLFVTLHRVSHR